MAERQRFHPRVAEDLSDAIDWYERRCTGLGARFAAAVDRRFDQIQDNPELFPRAFLDSDLRFSVVPRFPYLVLFQTLGDTLFVLGVFHSATDPARWRGRERNE